MQEQGTLVLPTSDTLTAAPGVYMKLGRCGANHEPGRVYPLLLEGASEPRFGSKTTTPYLGDDLAQRCCLIEWREVEACGVTSVCAEAFNWRHQSS